jgi:hypothetical protein
MNHLPNQTILPFVTWLMLTAGQAIDQTPAPATNVPFQLPLSDGSTAQARLLPTHDGESWLVYATSSGKVVAYYLSPTTPTPPPDPIPPIPPTPQKLTIAIVENPTLTTQQQRAVLASPEWRAVAAAKHNLVGIIPNDVIDKETNQPPTRLAPFLNRAKLHNLPWIMFTNAAGAILWEGQVPTTAQELAALIAKYGG